MRSYNITGAGASSKTLALTAGGSALFGLYISGSQILPINNFSINFTSDATASCSSPFKLIVTPNSNDEGYDWTPSVAASNNYCSAENYGFYNHESADLVTITPAWWSGARAGPATKIEIRCYLR